MDLVTLALAKSYTDKEIQKAEMGDIQLDTGLGKTGFAADSGAVKEYVDNAINNIPAPPQVDWEQRDFSAPDYIKNKPFYLNRLQDNAIDTPQNGEIYKLWDFNGNSKVWSKFLSKENIIKRPNQKLENEVRMVQQYLIYLGMYMPPIPGYEDEPWLSGVYSCSGFLGSSSYPFISIGESNYKVKITSMTYYFVFDVTTLDEENSALFSEFGLYVQPDDNWNNTLPLQGVVQVNQVIQISDWFIPESIARVEDIPVTSVNGQTGDVVLDATEQIQSDWNQNDETAKDYIKNRTHYKEVIKECIYEKTLEFTSNIAYVGIDIYFTEDYEDDDDVIEFQYLVNGVNIKDSERFVLEYDNNDDYYIVKDTENAETIEFKLVKVSEKYVPLPKEYLPKNLLNRIDNSVLFPNNIEYGQILAADSNPENVKGINPVRNYDDLLQRPIYAQVIEKYKSIFAAEITGNSLKPGVFSNEIFDAVDDVVLTLNEPLIEGEFYQIDVDFYNIPSYSLIGQARQDKNGNLYIGNPDFQNYISSDDKNLAPLDGYFVYKKYDSSIGMGVPAYAFYDIFGNEDEASDLFITRVGVRYKTLDLEYIPEEIARISDIPDAVLSNDETTQLLSMLK